MKPIDHRRAVAKVILDGLGICGFLKPNWEVRFLRQGKHTLSMDIEGESLNVAAAGTIEIRTVDGDTPDYNTDYPKGCFYESNIGRSSENMRWALNLKNPLDVGETLTLKAVPATMITIHDALLYVSRLFPTDLYRVPANIPDPNPDPEQYRFGVTSDELTADVFCKAGGKVQVIVDGGVVKELPASSLKKTPYLIAIRNMDRVPPPTGLAGPLERGDFEYYYDACVNPTQRYAFWGLPKADYMVDTMTKSAKRDRDPFSDRTDCNIVWSDPYP
jgi:hypothetical protein